MQQHLAHSSDRFLAMGLAAVSTAAMFYVGLYQSRAVRHLWCPVFKKGCEAVADAAFAKSFGIPDGYIAVALYVAMILLLLGPVEKLWIWIPLLILASLATLANFLGNKSSAVLARKTPTTCWSWLGRGLAPYSVGSAYPCLPVSSGSASLAEP